MAKIIKLRGPVREFTVAVGACSRRGGGLTDNFFLGWGLFEGGFFEGDFFEGGGVIRGFTVYHFKGRKLQGKKASQIEKFLESTLRKKRNRTLAKQTFAF